MLTQTYIANQMHKLGLSPAYHEDIAAYDNIQRQLALKNKITVERYNAINDILQSFIKQLDHKHEYIKESKDKSPFDFI